MDKIGAKLYSVFACNRNLSQHSRFEMNTRILRPTVYESTERKLGLAYEVFIISQLQFSIQKGIIGILFHKVWFLQKEDHFAKNRL